MKWGEARMKQEKAQNTTPHAIHRGRFLWPPTYESMSDRRICDISLPLRMIPESETKKLGYCYANHLQRWPIDHSQKSQWQSHNDKVISNKIRVYNKRYQSCTTHHCHFHEKISCSKLPSCCFTMTSNNWLCLMTHMNFEHAVSSLTCRL